MEGRGRGRRTDSLRGVEGSGFLKQLMIDVRASLSLYLFSIFLSLTSLVLFEQDEDRAAVLVAAESK